MEKRGQFYLLAAIVIVAVIIGFAAISNYSEKKKSSRLIDLGEELGIEGDNVLDYGVYTQDDQLEDFIARYEDYAGEGENLYFIFGGPDGLYLITYEEIIAGSITIGESGIEIPREASTRTSIDYNEELKIYIDGVEYIFNLKPGENFYFLISERTGEEQNVVQG